MTKEVNPDSLAATLFKRPIFLQPCMCLLYCLLPSLLSANVHSIVPYPADMLLSLQVCLKVRHHWFMPEWEALQSWAAVSILRLQKPPPQTSFLCMWWSGCASVSTFPSSSNLECMLLEFIQTTRVRVTLKCSVTHSFQQTERLVSLTA